MTYRAYKTQIALTLEQEQHIGRSMGICRFLYNKYLEVNFEGCKNKEKFMSAISFRKWVNHELSRDHPWIKQCPSVPRFQVMKNAEVAFTRYFKKKSGRPRFKKKIEQNIGLFYEKASKGTLAIEDNKIKIPIIGWVQIKEKDYIPTDEEVRNATITQKADKYFISVVTIPKPPPVDIRAYSDGIGVDLGIKEFAYVSTGESFENINKTKRVKKVVKRLKRIQRAYSRKKEMRKKVKLETYSNLNKNLVKLQRLHMKLASIREYERMDVIKKITDKKPKFITLEGLNIKGMMKNRHLSRSIGEQGFYSFKMRLKNKCDKLGIELREVDMFYPSSKLCSNCGEKKVDLSLKDRVFKCDHCEWEMDRDLNAALNLKYAADYTVLN